MWDTSLKHLIISYFQDLFRSNGCDGGEILNTVERRVTMEQNNELSRAFKKSEIKKAVFSMHSDKSPGPDGLNPGFHQSF